MKIRHIYTVVRDSEIKNKELAAEMGFFRGAMKEEAGEYLYGGAGDDSVSISMLTSSDNGLTWEEVT